MVSDLYLIQLFKKKKPKFKKYIEMSESEKPELTFQGISSESCFFLKRYMDTD